MVTFNIDRNDSPAASYICAKDEISEPLGPQKMRFRNLIVPTQGGKLENVLFEGFFKVARIAEVNKFGRLDILLSSPGTYRPFFEDLVQKLKDSGRLKQTVKGYSFIFDDEELGECLRVKVAEDFKEVVGNLVKDDMVELEFSVGIYYSKDNEGLFLTMKNLTPIDTQ